MKKNGIFEVDIKGFRQLQESKPKYIIIRELLQNAFDEEIASCIVTLRYQRGKAYITVTDDSPTGFRNLADAWTLFSDTYKRSDVKKRGRFNFGEKQVICLCDYVTIISTTGGVEFNVLKNERKLIKKKREAGSEIRIEVKMEQWEYKACIEYCHEVIVPENVTMTVIRYNSSDNSEITFSPTRPVPFKTFKAKLLTSLKQEDSMRNVTRETEVSLHKPSSGKSYIYEMGIPICEIDCDFSIDINQKVPLSSDRDNVDAKYLKCVYGEVLNVTLDQITPDSASNTWIREGFTSDRANKESLNDIILKRFGNKPIIANPFDKRSMDEAISNNYNVIHNSALSAEERGVIKENGLISTTSQIFKTGIAEGKTHYPDADQLAISFFCKKIAKEFLGLNIKVSFYDSPDATVVADYSSESNHLRFNVAHISDNLWKVVLGNNGIGRIQQPMLDLIIHELGHSSGMHYEQSYHECITKLSSQMIIMSLENPTWFVLEKVAERLAQKM